MPVPDIYIIWRPLRPVKYFFLFFLFFFRLTTSGRGHIMLAGGYMRTKVIRLSLSDAEYDAIMAAAEGSGMLLASWCRVLILSAIAQAQPVGTPLRVSIGPQ